MSIKKKEGTKYGTLATETKSGSFHEVVFYRTSSGREPVRDWLKMLGHSTRKRLGQDLFTLQLGWPLGMPLARKLGPNLWELRTQIPNGIARIIFTEENRALILLHGFIKKSQKTPNADLALAKKRLATLRNGKK